MFCITIITDYLEKKNVIDPQKAFSLLNYCNIVFLYYSKIKSFIFQFHFQFKILNIIYCF